MTVTGKPGLSGGGGHRVRATEGGLHVKDPDGFEVQMGGKRQ